MASQHPPVRELSATLPEPLAKFVGEITGDDGLYETPSEFVRDLIRHYMVSINSEKHEIDDLLFQAITENSYSKYSHADIDNVMKSLL
jgi:Arc/MetJ-type ribon-helix-helix transcriptional regulator